MNKSELITALSEQTDLPKETAKSAVDTMIDLMKQQLIQGGRIEIRGFGSLEVKEYKGYQGRNPRTGELVDVKPKKLPVFKCGLDLKDMLNS